MIDNLVYECDPEKNKKCTKEGCFINGGGCRLTLHKEFSINGKPTLPIPLNCERNADRRIKE